MRRQSPRFATFKSNGNSQQHSTIPHIENSLQNDQQDLNKSLQTLNNRDAFSLLKTFQQLSQPLLCKRTLLAHQLEEHQRCLPFARQSLSGMANCQRCLEVYLSHADSIPIQDLPLSRQIMQGIQQNGPELLAKIVELVPRSPNAQRYFNLTENLKLSGSVVNKLAVMQGNTGRKVIATSKISKNQRLLFIPHDKMITLELCQTHPLVKNIITNKIVLKSPKHSQFAIFLLAHRQLGKQSPFWEYLSLLPDDFSQYPLNYGEELIKELKGSCFIEQIQHKRIDMKKDYQAIVNIDQSFSRFSLQKFTQARLIVSSRVFGIIVEQVKTDALVPIADMLNHHIPKQTSWYYSNSSKGFVVEAVRQIDAGSEIFDSYGNKCNSRFLLNYGFVLPNNMHNQVVFEIQLGNLFENNHKGVKIRVSRFLDGRGFQDMIGLFRAVLDEHKQKKQKEHEDFALDLEMTKQTPFKNRQNQLAVWHAIETLVSDKLKQYPTSITEDKKLLKGKLNQNMYNVVVLRKGEKEVLSFYQTMCKKMIKYFSNEGRKDDLSLYESYLEGIEMLGQL